MFFTLIKNTSRKLAALLLATVVAVGFSACNSKGTAEPDSGNEAVNLKVWASQDDQAFTQELIDSFIVARPEKNYNIELGVVGEPDAAARYLEDPAAAADVFSFANDQILTFTNAGGLYEITRNKEAVIAADDPGSIDSATVDGKLYGYPMTADNGYFLYYDKSVISEEQVKSMDGILEACNAAGKRFFMDISNGWYMAGFFLGAGGILEFIDNVQYCDFNNETGVLVGESIYALCGNPAYMDGDDAVLQGGMGDTIAAGVSGMWVASVIEEKLGENYGATKLPTFTVGDEQVQMSSFSGYKLVGVNSQTKHPLDAMDLAEWLTNEENQVKRYEARQFGPSNINASQTEAVVNNIPLSALYLQNQYATPQNNVSNSFWSPAEAFGQAMVNQDDSSTVKEFLDMMVDQITLQ